MIETLVIKIETIFVIIFALHILLPLSPITTQSISGTQSFDGTFELGSKLTSSPSTVIRYSTENWKGNEIHDRLKQFRIEVVKYGNNTHHLQFIDNYEHSEHLRGDISIRLVYRLLYHDLTNLNSDIFCKNYAPFPIEGDIEAYCLANLYNGGSPSDIERRICRICSADVNMEEYGGTLDVVLDCPLLPYQLYEFNLTATWDGHIAENYTKYHCTASDIPVASPMAYLSSFDIERSVSQTTKIEKFPSHTSNLAKRIEDSEEIINIYWRPISQLYAGDSKFNYTVRCMQKTGFKDDRLIFNTTKAIATLRKFAHLDAQCSIYTQNEVGISKDFSRIFIPKRSNRPIIGRKFKLLVTEVTNNHYRIRWTPFRMIDNSSEQFEYLPMNTSVKSLPGLFQLYWCAKKGSGRCEHLDGMVRNLNSSTYDLIMPAYSAPDDRRFGIAYLQQERVQEIKCSGITWSQCRIIDEKSLSLHVMRVVGFVSKTDSGKEVLTISWTIPECDPIIFDIITYEFNYCRIDHHKLCSAVWGSIAPIEPTKFSFRDNDEFCITKITKNKLNDNETLIIEDPGAHYYVRVRYFLVNGTASEWSNPVYIPAQSGCRVGWSLVFMIMIGIMLTTILYRRWARWFSYSKSILNRFNTTRANVGDIVDMNYKSDAELMAQKYCINKETIDSSGGLCDNVLEYIGGLTSDENDEDQYKDVQYKGDYIKRNLIESHSNDTTPENSSDSLRGGAAKDEELSEHDEISISSDSSFLNNILNSTPNASLNLDSNN